LGFEARGIDNHDFFIRFAKEKYDAALFEEGTAQDLAVTGYKADLVFCLEHLCEEVDIEGFLSAVSRILTPNGILYIEEPDGNHFNVPRRFSGWPVVFPPINFLYPSKSGLEKALRRHGLKIRKSFFTWRPIMRLVVTKA
jgi:ubiquinone/menaquinone biosynthesis C-methylase UbiE